MYTYTSEKIEAVVSKNEFTYEYENTLDNLSNIAVIAIYVPDTYEKNISHYGELPLATEPKAS